MGGYPRDATIPYNEQSDTNRPSGIVIYMARDLRKGNSDRKRSVTGRLRPGGKRRQGALNRETIVAAALSEIDRNGLESFSLRGLAKTLKVYPSAIVWHVTGRTSLLADAASLALADILPPGFPESWQGYLRDFFHRFREALRRHPNVAPLLATSAAASTPDRRAILTIRSCALQLSIPTWGFQATRGRTP